MILLVCRSLVIMGVGITCCRGEQGRQHFETRECARFERRDGVGAEESIACWRGAVNRVLKHCAGPEISIL